MLLFNTTRTTIQPPDPQARGGRYRSPYRLRRAVQHEGRSNLEAMTKPEHIIFERVCRLGSLSRARAHRDGSL